MSLIFLEKSLTNMPNMHVHFGKRFVNIVPLRCPSNMLIYLSSALDSMMRWNIIATLQFFFFLNSIFDNWFRCNYSFAEKYFSVSRSAYFLSESKLFEKLLPIDWIKFYIVSDCIWWLHSETAFLCVQYSVECASWTVNKWTTQLIMLFIILSNFEWIFFSPFLVGV